jgi:hypothetical protein
MHLRGLLHQRENDERAKGDLLAILGGMPRAADDSIELVLTFSPTPDGRLAPTLTSWELSYSCVDAWLPT